MDFSRNRKQRRAAAAASTPDPSVPLAHPPREVASENQKNGKTLVDIISERKNGLFSGQGIAPELTDVNSGMETRFVTVDPSSGEISGFDQSNYSGKEDKKETPDRNENQSDEPLPPFLDTILLSFPLSTLHLTLAYLAAHQYAAEIPLSSLFRESALISFPVLTFLIHLAHGHVISFDRVGDTNNETADKDGISLLPLTPEKLSMSFLRRLVFPPSSKALVFLPLAIMLGVKLMGITNEAPYYAVMKRAPAIGTLWVWSILEVPLGASILGALGPLGWGLWWKGYGLF